MTLGISFLNYSQNSDFWSESFIGLNPRKKVRIFRNYNKKIPFGQISKHFSNMALILIFSLGI